MTSRKPESLLSADHIAAARRPFEEASSLPAAAFVEPEVFQRERDRIFEREWLCVGRVDQVGEPGCFFTLDLMGDKLVVVRDLEGQVRVLSRVCPHRGADLVQGHGQRRSFQCPYHAWSFHLDGRLSGAPYMEGRKHFDRAACRLPELRSEVWQGWIFVNFDDAARPLGEQLGGLDRFLAHFDMEGAVAVETAEFDSPWNWKVLVDNFMEAYHHIATHNDTLEPFLPAKLSWSPDNEGPYSIVVMPSIEAGEAAASREAPDGSDPHVLVAAVVFPFHLFAVNADSLTWYLLLPDRHDHFTLKVFTCFPKAVVDDPGQSDVVTGLQGLTQTIHMQDIAACDATWSGLNARSFEQGMLSPLERPIWQFNQWWLDRVDDGA